MSFTAVLNNLVTTFRSDSDLAAFVGANCSRPLTVKKGFRRREEIGLDELPIIRITHIGEIPGTASGDGNNTHRCRLYAGIHSEDDELAPDLLIELGEILRKALVKDRRRGSTAQTTVPGEAGYDEGYLHPSYFLVLDFDIQTLQPLT